MKAIKIDWEEAHALIQAIKKVPREQRGTTLKRLYRTLSKIKRDFENESELARLKFLSRPDRSPMM